MTTIHVICKRQKEDATNLAARIIESYGAKAEVFVDEASARLLAYGKQLEIEHVGEGANLIVVLRGLRPRERPIVQAVASRVVTCLACRSGMGKWAWARNACPGIARISFLTSALAGS